MCFQENGGLQQNSGTGFLLSMRGNTTSTYPSKGPLWCAWTLQQLYKSLKNLISYIITKDHVLHTLILSFRFLILAVPSTNYPSIHKLTAPFFPLPFQPQIHSYLLNHPLENLGPGWEKLLLAITSPNRPTIASCPVCKAHNWLLLSSLGQCMCLTYL